MKSIFKVLLCVCALSVSGASAAYAGAKEDAIAAYDKGDYKRAARATTFPNKGAKLSLLAGVLSKESEGHKFRRHPCVLEDI